MPLSSEDRAEFRAMMGEFTDQWINQYRRDLFVAAALQGLLASGTADTEDESVAAAVRIGDAVHRATSLSKI